MLCMSGTRARCAHLCVANKPPSEPVASSFVFQNALGEPIEELGPVTYQARLFLIPGTGILFPR